jgi:two-component system, NarL family, response regulator DevR
MIFIVDDSKAVREHLAKMVGEIKGLEIVGEAQNFAEAIDGISKYKPELVILDIQIPGGTGIEVLRTIRQSGDPMIVLILTGHPYPQYRKKCLALGADYFLDKAKDIGQVKQILKDFVERHENEGF